MNFPMKLNRRVFALFSALFSALALLASAIAAAHAEDPVFPPGIRIGIVPLVGLNPARKFTGFESQDESVKVLMAELPAETYGEVMNALKTNPALASGAKPEGIETAAGTAYYTAETAKAGGSVVRRYSMILSGGTFSGYVAAQVPENASKIYSDEAVRQMFATATVRKEVPAQELLGLLPFRVDELGGFRNIRTLTPGTAILLADGDEKTGFEPAPFMVLGLMGSAPALPEDRGRFAEQAATSIPGVHSARVTMSEPQRIDGMAGYETRIEAISGKDNTPVTVVQWLRFGGQNAMRIIGSAPRDQWASAFARFRAVRDGVHPR
jgi:protein-L-isoaspartate O-methyltransferase